VSHLHADHVGGIDALLAIAPVDTVILPYLAPEDLAAMAMSDLAEGAFTGLSREYVAEPAGWWTARGVRRVIFIEPDPGDDDGPRTPGPYAPDPERPPEGLTVIARMRLTLATPRSTPESGLTAGQNSGAEAPADSYLAGGGSAYSPEWSTDAGTSWQSGDCVLVPYVHPVADGLRDAFRGALSRHVGFKRPPTPANFRKSLVADLAVPEKARKLADLYGNHFGQNHDAISMSLYSGPASSPSDSRRSYDWAAFGTADADRPVLDLDDACGWLTTGDAALKQEIRRVPWQRFFKPCASRVWRVEPSAPWLDSQLPPGRRRL
jgi:hypothetical protein